MNDKSLHTDKSKNPDARFRMVFHGGEDEQGLVGYGKTMEEARDDLFAKAIEQEIEQGRNKASGED